MKWELGESYQLFYFQVRESPATLNIPIPTPAPDRGGTTQLICGINLLIHCISRLIHGINRLISGSTQLMNGLLRNNRRICAGVSAVVLGVSVQDVLSL